MLNVTFLPKQFVDCGTNFADDLTVYNFKYYCDGLLVSIFGCLGIIGNLIALVVLSRPRLRDCFHQLLLTLACFDTLYIIIGGLNYTFKAFESKNDMFIVAFPHFIYPFTNITMNATIFMTMAISIERFLGICYPLHYPPHNRKSWFYILPVLLLSFILNIPKFLEGEIKWEREDSWGHLNRTEKINLNIKEWIPASRPTELRKDSNYIKFYKTYFRLFSTAVIPFLVLIVINARIIIELKQVKAKRFGSQRKLWKEMNMFLVLLCIVVIFVCCHVPRVIIDIWEFSLVESIVQCNDLFLSGEMSHPFHPSKWIECLNHVSHFTGILSSCTNFLIYSFIGHNFRKEFLQLLGLHRKPTEASEAMMTMSTKVISESRKSSYQGTNYQPCSSEIKPC